LRIKEQGMHLTLHEHDDVNFLLDAVPVSLLIMFQNILDLFVDEVNISL